MQNAVDQNPAMLKKLYTAVGKAFALEVDVVVLQKELYNDENSRKPTITFGTAAEDAFRRDAKKVKIMRTPLDPCQTFLDDPLGVIRLIRIGSRLGFSIAKDALLWMEKEEIH